MARKGYLASELALKRLARVTGDLREAARYLTDAMVCGAIGAVGRPHIEPERDESAPMVLRDLGSLPPSLLGDFEDIRPTFWTNAQEHDRALWDFEEGFVVSSDRHSAALAYGEIKLRLKDVNAFVELHRKRLADQSREAAKPKERLRHSSWDEWVAALATLAHEQVITADLKQKDLLDQIDNRLGRWGLEPKERSTVQTTASKVLERFRTNPPGSRVDIGG